MDWQSLETTLAAACEGTPDDETAEQAVRAAEGYALERVNNAEGDAKRFTALATEYRKAPAVTRKRIYLEHMAQLMPKLGRKLLVDEQAKGILPLLQLGETKAGAAQ